MNILKNVRMYCRDLLCARAQRLLNPLKLSCTGPQVVPTVPIFVLGRTNLAIQRDGAGSDARALCQTLLDEFPATVNAPRSTFFIRMQLQGDKVPLLYLGQHLPDQSGKSVLNEHFPTLGVRGLQNLWQNSLPMSFLF